MADITREQVIEWLSNQTVIEISQLVKDLEGKWGVSAAAPMAVAMAAPGAGAAAPAAEEKTEFNVILKEVGADKIKVIKVVRTHTNLGLKEAKDFVDTVPKTVKEGVNKAEAEAIKKDFEAAGAKIDVQ